MKNKEEAKVDKSALHHVLAHNINIAKWSALHNRVTFLLKEGCVCPHTK